jgi:outer membrane protein OmpA-like peptidoglycan-associated protein/opacity protein-like surface antigen
MRLAERFFATMAIAVVMIPALYADDETKAGATAKSSEPAASIVAPTAAAVPQPNFAEALPVGFSSSRQPESAAFAQPAGPMPSWVAPEDYAPRFEWFLGYAFWRAVPAAFSNRMAYLHGGSTSIAYNLNKYLGLVADFGGYDNSRLTLFNPTEIDTVNASGSAYTFLFGPRLSYRRHERFTPFAQALFGGVHASSVTISGCTGSPACTPLGSENTFAMTAGVGLDVSLAHHVAWRLIQAEYLLTRFRDTTSITEQTGIQNNVRLSTGIVFRFGGSPAAPPPPGGPPVASCSADKGVVYIGSGETVAVRAEASDPRHNPLTYSWTSSDGAVEGSGPVVRWDSSGMALGPHTVRARVDNGRGGTAECSAEIRVAPQPNRPPTMNCTADRSSVPAGDSVQINAMASDPDNDPLTYYWKSTGGPIAGSGASVTLNTSGLSPGRYIVNGQVSDGRGRTASCLVNIDVQPSAAQTQLEERLALRSIYFQTARPTERNPEGGLVESQQAVLASLAADFSRYLTFKPDAHLILGGHADVRGSVPYNKALTERRVNRAKRFLVDHGVPEVSIEVQAFGKQDNLSADEVKQQIAQNPDLSDDDRQKMRNDLPVIVLANNRRVDVSLSTTGQQSIRRYPFNAKDALALISTKGVEKQPAAEKSPKKQ